MQKEINWERKTVKQKFVKTPKILQAAKTTHMKIWATIQEKGLLTVEHCELRSELQAKRSKWQDQRAESQVKQDYAHALKPNRIYPAGF